MKTAGNRVRRHQLILGSVFVAASAVYLLVVHQFEIETGVMNVYFPYAEEMMNGSIPNMEYPPFAMVFIAIPALFSSTPFGYNVAFVAEACVFMTIGLLAMGKLAKRYNQSQNGAMLIYTVLMLLMFTFVADRYDIFPAILTLLSFYCLVTKRYVLAFFLLSIATMTKVYPAVLFPIYLIPFFMNRDIWNVWKGVFVFITTIFLILLPFFFIGTGDALYFLSFQMDRPLQIESLTASFIHLASYFGLTEVNVVFSYGSYNMIGPWPDAVVKYLLPMLAAVLIVIYVQYARMLSGLRKYKRDNENDRMIILGGTVLFSLLAFILMGKVFSSQYIIWIIPFITFMMITSLDHVSKNRIFILSIAVVALTQLNFAVNAGVGGEVINTADAGMLTTIARNIAVVALTGYTLWVCKKYIEKRHWRTQPSEEE
jgi:hypothetical protein